MTLFAGSRNVFRAGSRDERAPDKRPSDVESSSQSAEPVGYRPDRFAMSEARLQTTVERFEYVPFGLQAALATWFKMRRMGRLPLGE